jgi:hypothetical protein
MTRYFLFKLIYRNQDLSGGGNEKCSHSNTVLNDLCIILCSMHLHVVPDPHVFINREDVVGYFDMDVGFGTLGSATTTFSFLSILCRVGKKFLTVLDVVLQPEPLDKSVCAW